MKKVFAEGERSAVTISQMKQLATDGQVTSLKSLKSVWRQEKANLLFYVTMFKLLDLL